MRPTPHANLFKPSRTEAKSDTTTRVARMIVESESAIRDAKTERLRLARLARDAGTPVKTPAEPKPARQKRKG